MSLSLSRRRFTGTVKTRDRTPPTDHLRRGEGPSQHFWMMPKPKKPKQPLSSTPTIIFYQSHQRRRRREIEDSSHSKWGGCLASVCFMHPHASGSCLSCT